MGKDKHPKRVEIPLSKVLIGERPTSGGNIEKLVSIEPAECARAVANMSYDSLAEFTTHLSEQLALDAFKDKERGRSILAGNLSTASLYMKEARNYLFNAWKVCKNYM